MVNTENALAMVKARLNRLDTVLDGYLAARIEAAVADLERTGIALDGSTADLMLVVDYTCWAYANRDNAAGMPDWLRLRRRERWLNQRQKPSPSGEGGPLAVDEVGPLAVDEVGPLAVDEVAPQTSDEVAPQTSDEVAQTAPDTDAAEVDTP